jgi:hypothetical protein
MIDPGQQELVAEVAKDAVAQLSPQELPLFVASSRAFFKDPDAIQVDGKDEMIGFGVGEAAGMITPVVLAVTLEVVRSVGEQIKETLKEESGGLTAAWVRLVFKKYRPSQKEEQVSGRTEIQAESPKPKVASDLPVPLTPQQLAAVRQAAQKKARQLKLPEAKARILADAIVGGLVGA